MHGLYSVVLGLLVPLAWTAMTGEDHIVPPDRAIFRQWNRSSRLPMAGVKVSDRMMFEYQVDDSSSPLSLNFRIFDRKCDRLRVCLPFTGDSPKNFQFGKRYNLCIGEQVMDFDYKVKELTLPDGAKMKLNDEFSNDDVLTFFSNGEVTLRHGRKSGVISNASISSFRKPNDTDERYNFTLLQNGELCRTKLRDLKDGSAGKLMAIYNVLPPYRQTREGYNIWLLVFSAIGGSLVGGIFILVCEIRCRYTFYSGYYESLYTTYGLNPMRDESNVEAPSSMESLPPKEPEKQKKAKKSKKKRAN
ncbi:hypothetical protein QR680_013686 [Steinernema hermaphroditum]|uniref:Uncharacterized protein n=1 Tax=Steinernema hermaphroditum TaxID=289476 RepID=A0AA39I6C5_9BILA|nr:hypothetical protein QR680_013686 [Steinernema hermaphroditum]